MADHPLIAIRAAKERGDVAIKIQERIGIGSKTKPTTINTMLASQKRARFRRPVNENHMADRGMAIFPAGWLLYDFFNRLLRNDKDLRWDLRHRARAARPLSNGRSP